MIKQMIMAVGLMAGMTAYAQPQSSNQLKVTGGVKKETNLSNFIHSGISDGQSSMRIGATMGGFVELGVARHFSIQGALLFHYKESSFEWNRQEGRYQYWGAEIPIYALYHWMPDSHHRVSIGIGPYTDFGLKATFNSNGENMDLYDKETESGLPAFKDSDSGFGIMAGYEFSCGLQINAGYKISLSNVLDANSESSELHPQTVSLGVAWRFGK